MKKLQDHLTNFEDAQKMLGYEDYEWKGGSMTVIKENYHSKWESKFEEEMLSRETTPEEDEEGYQKWLMSK